MPNLNLLSATVVHVPMPFSTPGSTLIGVVDQLARCHTRGGGRALAILSDNRGLQVPHAENILVDHKQLCAREYFTQTEVVIDALSGLAGFRRPYFGRLHHPAITAVAEQAADVVLLYEGHYAAASLPHWNELRPKVRVILYVHNPLSRTYRRRELARLADQCDALVFCAEHLREDAARRIPTSGTPLVTIRNGIDESFLQSDGPGPEKSADDFDILFIGRTAPHKGPQHLIAALDRAQEQSQRRLKCTIVGSDNYGLGTGLTPFEQELRRMAGQSEVPVGFIRHVDRTSIAQLMRDASVICLPSVWSEGLPLVALEALAVGAPVVAFDVVGLVEACGDAARYAPVGNESALADAIAETANDSVRTAAQIERGRIRSAEFSWERAWRQFAELVDRL